MIYAFSILAFCCNHLRFAQGSKIELTNAGDTKSITKQLLFVNESTQVSCDIVIPEGSELPIMMMSVMLVKTLDSDIVPSIVHIFPSFHEETPVLDLSAAIGSQNFILSPSTSVFEIDFSAKILKAIPSSLMVHLIPYNTSTEHTIRITSSNDNGSSSFFVDFVVSPDSRALEGLYKFYLHSSESVRTKCYVLPSRQNVYQNVYYLQLVLYAVIGFTVLYIQLFVSNMDEVCLCLGQGLKQEVSALMILIVFTIAIGGSVLYAYSNVPAEFGFVYFIGFAAIVVHGLSCTIWKHLVFWSRKTGIPFHCNVKEIFPIVLVNLMVILIMVQSCDKLNFFEELKAMIFLHLLCEATKYLYFIGTLRMSLEYLRTQPNDKHRIEIEKRENDGKELFKLYVPFICCYLLFAFVTSFNVILMVLTWLSVPFHLFWIQMAIEDLLLLSFWLLFSKLKKRCSDYVLHADWQPTTLKYTDEDFIPFWMHLLSWPILSFCRKYLGFNKQTSNDNDSEKIKDMSTFEVIKWGIWFLLRNNTLMLMAIFSMVVALLINLLKYFIYT